MTSAMQTEFDNRSPRDGLIFTDSEFKEKHVVTISFSMRCDERRVDPFKSLSITIMYTSNEFAGFIMFIKKDDENA